MHEKSILLPLLPATLLAVEEPFIFKWFTQFAMLSMFPLICRDNLVVAYLALLALFVLILNAPVQHKVRETNYLNSYLGSATMFFILCCSFVLHIVYLTMHPPEKYPFLFEAIIMNLCFSQFVLVTLACNVKQWLLNRPAKLEEIEKKLIWHVSFFKLDGLLLLGSWIWRCMFNTFQQCFSEGELIESLTFINLNPNDFIIFAL